MKSLMAGAKEKAKVAKDKAIEKKEKIQGKSKTPANQPREVVDASSAMPAADHSWSAVRVASVIVILWPDRSGRGSQRRTRSDKRSAKRSTKAARYPLEISKVSREIGCKLCACGGAYA